MYLGVVNEALSIPGVGWKLACAGLLETLYNGLQKATKSSLMVSLWD